MYINKITLRIVSFILLLGDLYAGPTFKKVPVNINKEPEGKAIFTISVQGDKYPMIFVTKKERINLDPFNDKRVLELYVDGEKDCTEITKNKQLIIPDIDVSVIEINSRTKLEFPKIYNEKPKDLPKWTNAKVDFPLVYPDGSFVVITEKETEVEAQGYCYQDGECDPQGTYGIRNASGDPDRRLFNLITLKKTYKVFSGNNGRPDFCLADRYQNLASIVLDKNGKRVKDKLIRQ